MFKNLRSTFFAILTVLLFSAPASAQTQLGFGIAYGSDIEEGAITLKGNFAISGKVSLSPDFTYYFVDGNRRFSTLNGNFHWNFKVGNNLVLYPLVGAQFSFYRRFEEADTDTDLGINVGGGGMTALTENMLLYFELSGALADDPGDQTVLAVGVLFGL